MKKNDFKIMNMLPEGKENAVSSEVLSEMAGVRSKRELQHQIAKERKAGALILSTTKGGYYRSNNRDEIVEFIRTLEKRAKSTMVALKSARKYMKNIEGQIAFEEVNAL